MQETILPTEEEITQDLKEKKKNKEEKGKQAGRKREHPHLQLWSVKLQSKEAQKAMELNRFSNGVFPRHGISEWRKLHNYPPKKKKKNALRISTTLRALWVILPNSLY